MFLPVAPNVRIIAFVHPGGQDRTGGHMNHSTGEYHFHHGEPPHQHVLGYCTAYNHFLGPQGPLLIASCLGMIGYYFLLRQKKINGLN